MAMDQQAATAAAASDTAALASAAAPAGQSRASSSAAKQICTDLPINVTSVLKIVPKVRTKSGDGRKTGKIKAYSWENPPPVLSFLGHSAEAADDGLLPPAEGEQFPEYDSIQNYFTRESTLKGAHKVEIHYPYDNRYSGYWHTNHGIITRPPVK